MWLFKAGTSTRQDGLVVVATIRRYSQRSPNISDESLAQGMDSVAWEVTFPDYHRVEVPWSEDRATPDMIMAYCDRNWPLPSEGCAP